MNIKLKTLINEVEAKMKSLADYGAADTEPNVELQLAMTVALNSGRTDLPADGEAWQLYTQTYGKRMCNDAANELNKVVLPLVEFIAENRTSSRIQHDVRDYCWRI